jgi:hypothetical protein
MAENLLYYADNFNPRATVAMSGRARPRSCHLGRIWRGVSPSAKK